MDTISTGSTQYATDKNVSTHGGSAEPMTTKRIFLVLAAGLIAGLTVRWVSQGDEDAGQPLYRTSAVQRRLVVQTVEATGRLKPREVELVSAPVEGRLAEVLVKVRQEVKKGDALARLDAGRLTFEVHRAKAGVAGARGSLTQANAAKVEAQQKRDRAQKLKERGQLSEAGLQAAVAAFERANAAVRVARARLAEARASLEAAEFASNQTEIVAPRDGVVLSVPEQLGLAVAPGGPVLFTISAALEVLRLEARVGEADIGELAVGQAAEFEVQAFPNESFVASVELIGVVAKTGEGVATYPVYLSAPNLDGRLLPGMSTAVRFEVARAKDALAVREGALRFRPNDAGDVPARTRIYKINADGIVETIDVEAGISDGVWAVIKPKIPRLLEVGDEIAVGYLAGERRSKPGLKIGG